MKRKITQTRARQIGDSLGLDWSKVSLKEFTMGMNDELEHRNVTHGNLITTAKIALAHLKENPKYYTKITKALK